MSARRGEIASVTMMDGLQVEQRYEALVRVAGGPLPSTSVPLHGRATTEEELFGFFQDLKTFEMHLNGQPVDRAWEIFRTFQGSLVTAELREVDETLFRSCFTGSSASALTDLPAQ